MALPQITPSIPFVSFFFKVCKSFKLVIPPEAIIGFLKIFVLFKIKSKSIPSIAPSFFMFVQTKEAISKFPKSFSISIALIFVYFTQPSIANLLSIKSIPKTIFPGYFLIASLTKLGLFTIKEPTTSLSTPTSNHLSIVFIFLIPPPN